MLIAEFFSLLLHQNTDKNQNNKKFDEIIICSSKERVDVDWLTCNQNWNGSRSDQFGDFKRILVECHSLVQIEIDRFNIIRTFWSAHKDLDPVIDMGSTLQAIKHKLLEITFNTIFRNLVC